MEKTSKEIRAAIKPLNLQRASASRDKAQLGMANDWDDLMKLPKDKLVSLIIAQEIVFGKRMKLTAAVLAEYRSESLEASEKVAAFTQSRRKGGLTKAARSEKSKAKAEALKLWKEWQGGKHKRLRTTQMFAMEVMRRWPVLTSVGVISSWSAKWNKSRKAGIDPAC